MSTPVKHRKISLETKKDVIDLFERNSNKSELARQFGLPPSTIRTILSNKNQILEAIADGKGAKRARFTTGRNEELEEALLIWFKQVRSQNIPVSGDLFKEKALEIAGQLEIEDFIASNGWMEKCKHRFGIQFKTEHGKAEAVEVESLEEWWLSATLQSNIFLRTLPQSRRRHLLRERVKAIEEKKDYKTSLINAPHLLRRAWDNVKEETVKNCFRHAKFEIVQEGIEEVLELVVENETNDNAMNELADAWKKLQIAGDIDKHEALEDYLDVDDDVITGGTFSINEILEKYATAADESDVEEVAIEEEEADEPVTSLDAMRALRTLRKFVERNFRDPAILRHSDALDDALYAYREKNQKQTKISEFFTQVL